MADEFRLPDLGEGVHEGRIVAVLVRAGDAVVEDVPLIEVETDKATVEIPCPQNGVIAKVHVAADEVVAVGAVMFTFAADPANDSGANKKVPVATTKSLASENGSAPKVAAAGNSDGVKRASPVVRKLARELDVDLAQVVGTGPRGRITRGDVEAAAQGGPAVVAEVGTSTAAVVPVQVPKGKKSQATANAAVVPSASLWPSAGTDGDDQYGRTCRLSISQARQTIAQQMSTAWTTIPHVTDCELADVTDLDRLRRGFPDGGGGGRAITMLAFVVKAVATALSTHLIFNGYFDAEKSEIVFRDYVNIALGVQTERGLMAPVLRHADKLSIVEIADAIVGMSERARANKFAMSDLQGGTYTISNAGAFGGSWFSTPIITPGQSAVLAIGRSRKLPWVVGENEDGVAVRLIMPLSHSFDHRLADGGQEVAFLKQIMTQLEDAAGFLD